MTGRQLLHKEWSSYRKTSECYFILVFLFLISIPLTGGDRPFHREGLPLLIVIAESLLCFVFLVAGVASSARLVCCPWCREGLFSILSKSKLSKLKRMRYCPYCGKKLDDEVPEKPSKKQL